MVPYTRLHVWLGNRLVVSMKHGRSRTATDVPATYERHYTRTRFNDFRMREHERQCEASDDNKGGDEAAEVDGS
jgi:hypothetical protein